YYCVVNIHELNEHLYHTRRSSHLESNANDEDTDPENELITNASLASGTLTITEAGTDHNIDLLSSDTGNNLGSGTDGRIFLDLGASDVDFVDTVAGLGVNNVQGAIEALAESNADDEDTDPENELQDIQLNATTNILSLISPATLGNLVDLSIFNQTVSAGDGISVAINENDFQVAVTNPVVAMGKVDSDGTMIKVSQDLSIVKPPVPS